MPASEALLNGAAALLLIAVAWHVPRLGGWIGREGLAFLTLGALVPLLDPARFALTSEDQIAFLTQDPFFAGPLPGAAGTLLAAGAAVLMGIPARRCLRAACCALAGLAGSVGLEGLTPAGAPWLAPYSSHRFAWPVLPEGHPVPIALAALTLTLLELRPGWRKPIQAAAGTLLLALVATGVAGQVALPPAGAVPAGAHRTVEPDPVWPGRWLDIVTDGPAYTAVTRGLGSEGDSPTRTLRWNDETRLLTLLEDPAVRRMYSESFRHPVARIEAAGSQIRLSVRELSDALVDARGAALLLQTDVDGRRRAYRVERLD